MKGNLLHCSVVVVDKLVADIVEGVPLVIVELILVAEKKIETKIKFEAMKFFLENETAFGLSL